MKRLNLHIVLLLVFSNSFGQVGSYAESDATYGTGVIRVRKINIKLTRSLTTKKVLLTTSDWKLTNVTSRHKNNYFTYFITDNVLMYNKKVYFFSKDIPDNIRNIFGEKNGKTKFWGKIRKLKRKNKIHYFRISASIDEIDSMQTEYYTSYNEVKYFNAETKEFMNSEREEIEDSNTTKDVYKHILSVGIGQDTISMENVSEASNYFSLLDNLVLGVKKNLKIPSLFIREYKSYSTIYKSKYSIQFDLKDMTSNKLTIVRNNKEKFVCDYTVKGRKIFIQNAPIGELKEGKFTKQKSIIKFKVHNIWHEYKLRNK